MSIQQQLQKIISKIDIKLNKATNEIMQKTKEQLKESVNDLWYSTYSPIDYIRTYETIDAVSGKVVKNSKDVISAMQKFCNKDWGNASQDSKNQNEENLSYPEDLYLFATYKTCEGEIWIITNRATENPGENVTTVLFPDEY